MNKRLSTQHQSFLALLYSVNFLEVVGKQLTVIFIKNSASSSSAISFAVADLGAHDKASAVTNNFPDLLLLVLQQL